MTELFSEITNLSDLNAALGIAVASQPEPHGITRNMRAQARYDDRIHRIYQAYDAAKARISTAREGKRPADDPHVE